MSRQRIAILGSGNVATHLSRALSQTADIVQVYSRDITHARMLADALHCPNATDSLANLVTDADIYLMAVSDDAIEQIAAATPDTGIWAHTSGSIALDVLKKHKSRCGVFYPLQTFSRTTEVDFNRVPIFLEGSDPATAEALHTLARQISPIVNSADSRRRRVLHVAAVFACNFTNFMLTQADDILRAEGLDLSILTPLLEVTLDKVRHIAPAEAQTGPARRADYGVIEAHKHMLSGDAADIYDSLSKKIIKRYEQN